MVISLKKANKILPIFFQFENLADLHDSFLHKETFSDFVSLLEYPCGFSYSLMHL